MCMCMHAQNTCTHTHTLIPSSLLTHCSEEGSGPAQDTNDDTVNNDNGEAGVQENEYGTMPSSTVLHQGSDSNEWGEETNNNN